MLCERPMGILCERPPALLTPPNVIITPKTPEKTGNSGGTNQNNNNLENANCQTMKVRLVEVS